MESVLITMKTRQITPDGDEETELMTTGTCEMRDDTLQLSYEDTDATGFAGSTTTIQVANESRRDDLTHRHGKFQPDAGNRQKALLPVSDSIRGNDYRRTGEAAALRTGGILRFCGNGIHY